MNQRDAASADASRWLTSVIDVGSSAIRLIVAEVDEEGGWRRLDRATRPVALGRDVFSRGFISRETMLQSIRILTSFVELIEGWGLSPEQVNVIGTSALREARNRDTFLDRVYIRTGLQIEIIEGVEENHLTYLAVRHAVRLLRPTFERSSSLIIEVGGGTSEMMILNRGRMVAAHSLRMGTVRLQQQFRPSADFAGEVNTYLRETVRATAEVLEAEFDLSKVRYFVAVGGEARIVARKVGRFDSAIDHSRGAGEQATDEEAHFAIVEKEDFCELVERLQTLPVEARVRELRISYHEAETLMPALLIYRYFLETTNARQLIVPEVSIREGVLINFALGQSHALEEEFYTQVIASAIGLGRKYHFDESHARHVAALAGSLFDQLGDEHGLDRHARLLLEVAALLHDIGNFVRSSGHHKHSQYLVANSELFGFSRDDIRIVSNLVRYHRKSPPVASHTPFISLRREHRLMVMKLGAILRLADALDRSHGQRVKRVKLQIEDGDAVLDCAYSGDIAIERYGIELKGDMFEDVFGYTVRVV